MNILFIQKDDNYLLSKQDAPLQKIFSMIFKKSDISLFNYDLLDWGILSDEQNKVYTFLKNMKQITVTYKELGLFFGFHQRKIAYLMKLNPFAYVIPCHRVIAKDSIGGYKFSVELKKEILEFEKNTLGVKNGFIRQM